MSSGVCACPVSQTGYIMSSNPSGGWRKAVPPALSCGPDSAVDLLILHVDYCTAATEDIFPSCRTILAGLSYWVLRWRTGVGWLLVQAPPTTRWGSVCLDRVEQQSGLGSWEHGLYLRSQGEGFHREGLPTCSSLGAPPDLCMWCQIWQPSLQVIDAEGGSTTCWIMELDFNYIKNLWLDHRTEAFKPADNHRIRSSFPVEAWRKQLWVP